jgi:CheY-like chemotaxis protein
VSQYFIIAEDDEDDRFLLKSAFTESGNTAELVFVSDGLELVNIFKKIDEGSMKSLPSLLIVDLNMPKKNGREAISEINEKPYFKTFPTVIFSTSDNLLEREKCRSLGLHNFFVKPPSYSKLLEMVTEFIKLAKV